MRLYQKPCARVNSGFEYFGVEKLEFKISHYERRINPDLEIAGILLTMCEKRTTLCKVLTEEVTESFHGQIRVFDTKIPNTVKVGESIYYGKPLEQYSPKASAGVAYRKLAKELISYEG